MTEPPAPAPPAATDEIGPSPIADPRLALRAAVGGVLMGLANLVPGVSGGTMLLAAGVYEAFVASVAQISTLRLHLRPILVLGIIAGSAIVAILALAGPTKDLVVHQRWVMYSLFIGLTLGGVPLVWRMARPATPALAAGALIGLAGMIALAMSEGAAAPSGDGPETGRLVVAGVAGASAMVLPGISGGYLLLLLGQYVPILSALEDLRLALSASGGPDLALLRGALTVVIPVGVGVAVGVVGVSNLVRWLLVHARQATLGLLLGLLFGAVVGLWPFQEGVPPAVGDTFKGRTLDAAAVAAIEPEDYPLARFEPSPVQAVGSLALIGLGLLVTLAIDRLGRTSPPGAPDEPAPTAGG
jgi:putative membrane protein